MHGPHPQPPPPEWILEDFLKHQPAKFDGKTSPDQTDQWMKDMERIFDAKRCPNESRLAFIVYMLTREAEHWWASMRLVMEERHEEVTWKAFKRKFLSEYFPDSVRYAKEVEFLQLVQGDKSVAEYAERFKHLGRFYTMPLDEEWRYKKFENGLRGDFRLMVAPLSIKDFAALVERARVMERMKAEVEAQQVQQQKASGSSRSRSRVEERKKPYFRPQPQVARGFTPQQSSVPRCYQCNEPHLRSACPQLASTRRCHGCGKTGHLVKDCPSSRGTAMRSPVQTPA